MKKNRLLFLLLLAAAIWCGSCGAGRQGCPAIDLTKTVKLTASIDPSRTEVYDRIPPDLKSLLTTVDEWIAEEGSPADPPAGFSAMKELLSLTLEQEDHSLILVTIYLLSEEEGWVRCIGQSPEDVQTTVASFSFRDPGFVQEVQAVRSAYGK